MTGIEKLQLPHVQIPHILNIWVQKCFWENFVNISKVSSEKLSRLWDIKSGEVQWSSFENYYCQIDTM